RKSFGFVIILCQGRLFWTLIHASIDALSPLEHRPETRLELRPVVFKIFEDCVEIVIAVRNLLQLFCRPAIGKLFVGLVQSVMAEFANIIELARARIFGFEFICSLFADVYDRLWCIRRKRQSSNCYLSFGLF